MPAHAIGAFHCEKCDEFFRTRKEYREHRRQGCGKVRVAHTYNCPSCGEVKLGKHKTSCTASEAEIAEARKHVRKELEQENYKAHGSLDRETLEAAVFAGAADLKSQNANAKNFKANNGDVYSLQITEWLETLSDEGSKPPLKPPKVKIRGNSDIDEPRLSLRGVALALHSVVLGSWEKTHEQKKKRVRKKKKKNKKSGTPGTLSESAKRLRSADISETGKEHSVSAESDPVARSEAFTERHSEHADAASAAGSSVSSSSGDSSSGSSNSDDESENDGEVSAARSDGATEIKLQGGMPYSTCKSLDLLHVFTELDDWAPESATPEEVCKMKLGASEIFSAICWPLKNETPVLALRGCECRKLGPYLTGFFYRVEDFNGRVCFRKVSKLGAGASFEYHPIYVFWNSAKNCWNIGRRINDKPAMAFSATDTKDPTEVIMQWMLLQVS